MQSINHPEDWHIIRADSDLLNIENINILFAKIDLVLEHGPALRIFVDLSRANAAGTAFMNSLVALARKHPLHYSQVQFYDPQHGITSAMESLGLTKLFKITAEPESEKMILL